MPLLIFNISGGELFIILFFALLFFGSKNIPNVARSLGKGIRQVKNASGELQKDIRESADQIKEDWNDTQREEERSGKYGKDRDDRST